QKQSVRVASREHKPTSSYMETRPVVELILGFVGQDEEGMKRLLREDFFEKRKGTIVVRLPQPEHGLFADNRVLVVACNLNEERDTLVFGKLVQGKDRFLFDLCFRILIDCGGDRFCCTTPRLLRQPEKRLATDTRANILTGRQDESRDRLGFRALR